jgi:hypothetical protein
MRGAQGRRRFFQACIKIRGTMGRAMFLRLFIIGSTIA